MIRVRVRKTHPTVTETAGASLQKGQDVLVIFTYVHNAVQRTIMTLIKLNTEMSQKSVRVEVDINCCKMSWLNGHCRISLIRMN